MSKRLLMTVLVAFILLSNLVAAGPDTRRAKLEELSAQYARWLEEHRPQLYFDLLKSDNPAQARLNENRNIQLMFIDDLGHPEYYTINNLNAAKTISTDDVWPGGSAGLSLSGLGTFSGELGIWDAGAVLTTHQEFGGRVIQMDSPGSTHYHATHVSGTMVGAGVDPSAKGMSYEGTLAAYDWSYDESEMASAAASGMNTSNHSYGFIRGWYYNSNDSEWYWYGNTSISATEDYKFGFYDWAPQDWDDIAYNAPYYTIVKSAGNERNDYGPGPGGGHYAWTGSEWVWSTDTRDQDGGTDGYDCLAQKTTAKNIIAVGAVDDIPAGYGSPGDVVASSFTSWGPTDDGRIKPDLVANGVSLYSCTNSDDTSYISLNGTSMSAPNLSGSLNLLVQYYEATHATTPLSSTMKAILIHTADEAGPDPGPDYMFGWGLMNTMKASRLIDADALVMEPGCIYEDSARFQAYTPNYSITSDGSQPIRITIAWTDPPGTPPSTSLNPPDLMLVNDLDVRLEHLSTSTIYYPYILDPANPSNAATTGDNFRDNVEQIYVEAPLSGKYQVSVSIKNSGSNSFSIVGSHKLLQYICGDADGDGSVDMLDILHLINYLYKGGPPPDPPEASDVNNDGSVDMLDILHLINYLYKGGPEPTCP
jgi:hypothetical protein